MAPFSWSTLSIPTLDCELLLTRDGHRVWRTHDGLEALQMWGDPALRQIPVIVLSADATSGQIWRLMAAGAHANLTKPLDLCTVLETLDRRLGAAGGAEHRAP